MKIVIVGAGSVAFTPALLSGFGTDKRYQGATLGFVDVNEEVLEMVAKFAKRASDELGMNWKIEASTNRKDVLPGADIVTTSIGVGGLEAWELDVDVPYQFGFYQPVGDTSGPGGLGRALRHIPVLVGIGKDMETLCPDGILYNFTNPLTVLTQAVNKLTKTKCIGLCIGPDLTWDHLCRVVGVEKKRTSAVIGGINHCHWITDFRLEGEDAFPILSARLDELEGSPESMDTFRKKYKDVVKRPQEPNAGQPLCATLFRLTGAYPGPGDGHVIEFYPQFIEAIVKDLERFQGAAIKNVRKTYPPLTAKMKKIADGKAPIHDESFAKELSWEHTQLLDILVSWMDNKGETFFINVPNKGSINNMPAEAVVEVPATVDRAGVHPFALGDLPESILPMLNHKVASLDLIIEAAMEGSRRRAVQAMINDPYCTDMVVVEKCVNALIDAELKYLPNFQ